MYAIDFEYDGRCLSDYGFIICSFSSASGADTVSAGSEITFNKVAKHYGKTYSLTSTQYDNCITTTFHICKNPDIYELEKREISPSEYRDLMRWLNRREFYPFTVFDEDVDRERVIYYNASFNISKVKINEILYGLELTMETDKPFGYGLEKISTLNFLSADSAKTIYDTSDEIGSTYPQMEITCMSDGDLTITNSFNGVSTIIKGCANGEVITLDCQSKVIITSLQSHDICNDFNYEFFRIGNTISSNENKITVSIPCKIKLSYSPIIKDTP